eukprot:CAMPEP_0202949946 /NCGR_PEP_ID=MMETSP1395-20130829/16769_1 /ASSEMBLY_ACC=CAM_ASM_000871 /TAXON_ID=5961 /ORGANISM="Blepharisma japonicum, Strain Stock R1072" /LENGTH=393 /DNA_ID=CAMNT_0049653421 /DNA_START=180 /DNA_END=1358 /DNA_ORIENTATION=-
MKIIENERQKLEEERKKEETFHPNIEKSSKHFQNRPNSKTENLLIEAGKTYQAHLDELKEERQNVEMIECSFHPTISESRTSRSREQFRDVYTDLYNDAEQRKSRNTSLTEQSISQYSFKPKVKSHNRATTETKEEIFERLYSSKSKFYEDMEERKKQMESVEVSIDQVSGQELFHPAINNTKGSITRGGEEPIWEHLYSLKDVHSVKQQEENDKTLKFWEASSAAKKLSDASQKIFQDFQQKQLEKLFKSFDSDEDGKISSGSIKIEHLDVKSLVILSPYLNYLEESKEENDLDQFLGYMDELIKSMNVGDKSHLLKREVKPVVEEKIVLVSPKSAKLAEKRRGSLPDNIYDRLVWTSQLNELKANELRLMRERAELSGCTFKPVTKAGKKK